MESFNAILLKIVLVVVTAPAWYPFLKAVWQEFNEALADEGGVFGPIPSMKEREEIERERAGRPDPLIHRPWPTREERLSGRRQFRDRAGEERTAANRNGPPRGGPRFR